MNNIEITTEQLAHIAEFVKDEGAYEKKGQQRRANFCERASQVAEAGIGRRLTQWERIRTAELAGE